MILPTIDRLHELFTYDPATGILTRRSTGKPVGALKDSQTPYLFARIDREVIRLHRVVYAMYHRRWPELLIDHINGERMDNRIANLREVTHQQNTQNRKINRNNKLGIKGVARYKDRFRAHICANGVKRNLGYFDNAEDASQAYQQAAKELFGEYARTN